MNYTVGEMAKMIDIPATTLRYYDKEGLLPYVERTDGGIRVFKDSDIEWLQIITCMKKAGMSIQDIKLYVQLIQEGNDTIDTRLQMFKKQRKVLEQQLEELKNTINVLDYKCWYYETAKEAGSTDIFKTMSEKDYPKKFQSLRKELKKATTIH